MKSKGELRLEIDVLRHRLAVARDKELHLLSEVVALKEVAQPRVDCSACVNRGVVEGSSQETYCEHCVWQESWRKNHYAPNTEE